MSDEPLIQAHLTSITTAGLSCPECGMPAWFEDDDDAGGSGYGDRIVRVRCFARHWFLMMASRVPAF